MISPLSRQPMKSTASQSLSSASQRNREIAALREAAKRIPNQDVLINTIPLREAKDSSAIENIVTTNDKLFRFANGTRKVPTLRREKYFATEQHSFKASTTSKNAL